MLKRATVIKSSDAASARVVPFALTPVRRAVIIRRAVVSAKEVASTTLAQADAQAQAITAAAESEAAAIQRTAAETGRAEGYAEAMVRTALVGQIEAAVDERALNRTISLARLLAERLLGKSLLLDEETVVYLAQQALAEMKGARQVRLLANPDDAAVLQDKVAAAQPGFAVIAESNLARGDFRIVTDVGTIDASLNDRLDLLAAKLSESLKKGT